MSEILVIGLGGTGAYVIRRLAERLLPALTQAAAGDEGEQVRLRPPTLLILDTDRSAPPAARGLEDRTLLLSTTAAVLDAAYRTPERFQAEWLDRRILRGRSFGERGTQGCRALGRLLMLLPDNRSAVRERLDQWLRGTAGGRRRVFVVASASGGTGSGMLLDVAYLLQEMSGRAAGGETSGESIDARLLLLAPPPSDPGAANAFAALTELHYYSDPCTRYRAHLGEGDEPFTTRRPPYRRSVLFPSITSEGQTVPFLELQERAAMFLFTACAGDDGSWEAERARREPAVEWIDADGNPQLFSTCGVEWVEYPEERLVSAVYRNLLRRSIYTWLSGDTPLQMKDLRLDVPVRDPEAMASLLADTTVGEAAPEEVLRPVQSRSKRIAKAPPSQWAAMDQELEEQLAAAAGSAPSPGRPGTGPMADRAARLREQAIGSLRQGTRTWLSHDNMSLERVARALNELAAELRTATDPGTQWLAARDGCRNALHIVLWSVGAARKDPFLAFWRAVPLRKLAREYERLAGQYAQYFLMAHSVPYVRESRAHLLEPVRAWASRIGELGTLFARVSRAWADHEAAMLERLRKDLEEQRLALGLLRLPGAETPYIANGGWNLPYCRPEDEAAAIRDLRRGWIQLLVDRDDALLAGPGRSVLDGAASEMREERLPWVLPSAYAPTPEEASTQMRAAVAYIDQELRTRIDDRLRAWLGATAFQRLAEQHRNPVDLEFELRRLVNGAADLPALDPPHARPAGFPPEYEMVFFSAAKQDDLPSALEMVLDSAARDRPIRVLPSRSGHYLTALTEHPGFALSRSPLYHHLEESYRESLRPGPEAPLLPFTRIDVPWTSASLVTRDRLRDAANVLFLGLALGLLQPNPEGEIPLPPSVLPPDPRARRFPLPGEFDLAVRQLAGDLEALEAVALAADRAVQSRGVEWCSLQVERAVRGENRLPVRFPPCTHPPGAPESLAVDRSVRLAALRAVARFEDLFAEYARTPTAQDAGWLAVAGAYACPACGEALGEKEQALPGACGRCREPLLPARVRGVVAPDGFRRIPNPYVVGTPLETRSSVFRGRDDIIEQVRERLIRPAQRTILILIGERRCGKTSALKQLQYRLEGDLTPLFVDMQGLTASDLPGFLWWLAWRMKEALDDRGISVELPSFEEFGSGPPDYQFETVILPEIRRKLSGGRVLLMLDEFEVLAQRVMNGTFDSRAFDYIRHLMQHGEGIEFLFAGTHVLRQFAANYVTFLFNIGVFLNVDFLRPDDALRLIQEPVAHAGVQFEPAALEGILELAGAHAYFTQMFCFHLVERLNRVRRRNVTREDVEEVSGPVIEAAGAHLDHVWGQLGSADRLLVSFFVEVCGRGQKIAEEELLQAAIRSDSSLRPFVFRTAVEKLAAVGLLRAISEPNAEGRPVQLLRLSAEVYRRWLQKSHAYSRLREEGLTWE